MTATEDTLFGKAPAAAGPPPHVVNELVQKWGKDPKKVSGWSPAKATAILHTCRKEGEELARRLAAADGAAPPPPPPAAPWDLSPTAVRLEAAGYIEEAMRAGDSETCLALMHSIHLLSEEQVKRMAAHVVKLLTGERT